MRGGGSAAPVPPRRRERRLEPTVDSLDDSEDDENSRSESGASRRLDSYYGNHPRRRSSADKHNTGGLLREERRRRRRRSSRSPGRGSSSSSSSSGTERTTLLTTPTTKTTTQTRAPTTQPRPPRGPKKRDENSDSVSTASSSSRATCSTCDSLISKKKCCEKCDGAHDTASCPWFKKDRLKHPDACRNKKKLLGGDDACTVVISRGRVVPQPPDGSCLFHSLSYGLKGTGATALRREIAAFIRANPDLPICDTPLRDWIKWESLLSVNAYASKMGRSGWGGGLELAAAAELKNVTIEVYEPHGSDRFKRISVFSSKRASSATVRVLYRGGVHYDALIL